LLIAIAVNSPTFPSRDRVLPNIGGKVAYNKVYFRQIFRVVNNATVLNVAAAYAKKERVCPD